MTVKLDRQQLINLVERIANGDGTDNEIDDWIEMVRLNVPAPTGYVTDLIYYHDRHGYPEPLSAAEIVDMALAYQAICL